VCYAAIQGQGKESCGTTLAFKQSFLLMIKMTGFASLETQKKHLGVWGQGK
jgi:hypothetical protein